MKDNNLIAEFMGYTLITPDMRKNPESWSYSYWENPNLSTFQRVLGEESKLYYDYSWSWIMPVLTKIEKEHDYFSSIECIGIGMYDFTLSKYYKEDPDELELPEGLLVRTDERATSFDDVRLEAVYKGVVEFIKWYNENSED